MPDEILRRLTPEDATQCVAVTEAVGWHHRLADWQRRLKWGGDGCFGIEYAGCIVATTIAITYQQKLAWIGVVVTHPDYQRRGYARQLMEATLQWLNDKGVACIMLDATGNGFHLYETLGFRPVGEMEVWQGQLSPSETGTAQPITSANLADFVQLDGVTFGVERPMILHDMVEVGHGWISYDNNRPAGCLLAVPRTATTIKIGPWYHHDLEQATALLATAGATFPGCEFRLDVPAANTCARSIAQNQGLKITYTCMRMAYGDAVPPPITQYSILSMGTG